MIKSIFTGINILQLSVLTTQFFSVTLNTSKPSAIGKEEQVLKNSKFFSNKLIITSVCLLPCFKYLWQILLCYHVGSNFLQIYFLVLLNETSTAEFLWSVFFGTQSLSKYCNWQCYKYQYK